MKTKHFNEYLSQSYELLVDELEDDEVVSGKLIARKDSNVVIEIKGRIPRFISKNNYADNFGLQWTKFRSEQLDSQTGLPLSSKRFWRNTKWREEELRGKTVLEVGSGAGRFTELLLLAGANVVTFDYSIAVEANYMNNADKGNMFIFQGDLFNIPFPDNCFDFVFCHGVLQHTPNPNKAYEAIFSKLRPGGKISIDYYAKLGRPSPWSTPKYFWRPITKRMKPERLLRLIQFYIPLYLPFDTFLMKIPKIGDLIRALIPVPCWNYTGMGLNDEQIKNWAIMDTFDALGAKYDEPKTLDEVKTMVDCARLESCEVFYGGNGIVANVVKQLEA